MSMTVQVVFVRLGRSPPAEAPGVDKGRGCRPREDDTFNTRVIKPLGEDAVICDHCEPSIAKVTQQLVAT